MPDWLSVISCKTRRCVGLFPASSGRVSHPTALNRLSGCQGPFREPFATAPILYLRPVVCGPFQRASYRQEFSPSRQLLTGTAATTPEHLERRNATRFPFAVASARPGARELHGDDKIKRRLDAAARANFSQRDTNSRERARWRGSTVQRYGYGDN
jgi:hypothetical protein